MIYNIITVAFGALRKVKSLPINYRYDTGQVLKIKGLTLPENYVVDFCNEGDSTTIPMVGTADGVRIPDEFLQTGKPVKAYIVLVGEDNSQTRYEITIPVNQRPARSDIEPTPEEQSVIDGLVAAMNTAVAESEESADRAGDAADRAETAVSHYPKIEDGNWYVWNPETGAYEDTGIQAEGEDGVGIQSATLNADFTLTLTFTDGTSYTTPSIRGEPGQSGQDGVSPTITVTAITGGHRVEITDAEGTKTFNVMDGLTGATPDLQIGTVTTLPAGSEATAEITGTPEQPRLNLGIPEGQKGDPGEVTQAQFDTALADKAPVITDTASGAIASFPDGADGLPLKSLVASIEPVQDLHGYDSPWPAGGGANLLDLDKASYNPLAYGLTVARDGDGVRITGTATQSGNLSFNLIVNYSDETLGGKRYVLQVFDVTSGYTVGGVWGFRTESERAFAISLTGITEGQVVNCFMKLSVAATTQTAWSPYSNICPISGWTGLEGQRTGKNLLNDSVKNLSGQNIIFGGPTSHVTGTSCFLKAGTYMLSVVTADGTISNLYVKDADTDLMVSGFPAYSVTKKTFTLSKDTNIRVLCYKATYTSVDDITHAQIELGSTASNYESYQGDELSVNWQTEAGTVYGGTLDVTNGVLTVDRAIVDLSSDISWATWGVNYRASGITGFYIYRSNLPSTLDFSNIREAVLTNLLPINNSVWGGSAVGYMTDNRGELSNWYETVSISNETAGILSTDTNAEAIEKFKGFLESTPLNVLYKLATPQTYTLTPQQMTTLLGTNNIWADTGDTTVEYRADTKLYLEKLTAPTEDDLIADHAITSGSFFMIGNTLYKATAAIANGATITPGTNATRLSLADALNLLS